MEKIKTQRKVIYVVKGEIGWERINGEFGIKSIT